MLAILILAVFYGKVEGEKIPKLVAQPSRDFPIDLFGHGKQ